MAKNEWQNGDPVWWFDRQTGHLISGTVRQVVGKTLTVRPTGRPFDIQIKAATATRTYYQSARLKETMPKPRRA